MFVIETTYQQAYILTQILCHLEVVYLKMVVMEQEFEFGRVEGKHVSIP
jgi:hypothetical protein